MDIQLPGRARISFGEVTADKVNSILDKVFAGKVPDENLLGQFSVEGSSSWKDVPEFFASSFFKPQTRRVLATAAKSTRFTSKNTSRGAAT
jgi:replicative superfamily II helicase